MIRRPPRSTLFPYPPLSRSADHTRLIGAGMISPFDIEDAVSETRRCVQELGFRGVFLRPNIVHNRTWQDRKSTRLNSSHSQISYAVFCLKTKNVAKPRRLIH